MSDSKEEIIEATYKVLCEEGYKDLSVRKIAEEADKDKSLIYHHYDDKKDLILSFLDSMKDYIHENHEEIMSSSKDSMLDKLLDQSFSTDEDEWGFRKALLELQAQASNDKDLADKLQEIDNLILDNIEEVFKELCVEEPEVTANLYISAVQGAINRKVALQSRDNIEKMRNEVRKMVEQRID